MATNTLINKMDDATVGTMSKSSYEWFFASVAVTVGQVCSLNLALADGNRALYVVPADAASTDKSTPVGVAMNAAAAGAKIRLCVAGYCESALVNGSTAKGDLLQIGATPGTLAIRPTSVNEGGAATLSLLQVFASALEADTAGKGDIWIYKQTP
tara:strand:- start:1876 stop:2340 length:465 start_codon:yes stop_codon:yes gene_type:complete